MNQNQLPKILLVDDRPHNLLALTDLLSDLEVEVLTAECGNEALQLVTLHEFALVLLDVQMPIMNGFEVAVLMRKLERTRHVPIIFLTAAGNDPDLMSRGYEAGAVDYIAKPIEENILMSKVKIFLELYEQKIEIERQRKELEQRVAEHTQNQSNQSTPKTTTTAAQNRKSHASNHH